jgi:hypothetical protein
MRKLLTLSTGLLLGCAVAADVPEGAERQQCEDGPGCTEPIGEGGGGSGSGNGSGGSGSGGPTTTDTPDGSGNPDEVCFPGDGTTELCLPLIQLNPVPADMVYGAGPSDGYFDGNPMVPRTNYRAPVKVIDLEAAWAEHGDDVMIYPNFRLDEIGQRRVGRYAVIQPHAFAHLQTIRNDYGPTSVISGYRSPGYNRSVDGASSSRHMWGDAVDFDPAVDLNTAKARCEQLGAYFINLYTTHIHCDWRQVPVDDRFFGAELGTYRAALLPSVGAGSLEGPYDASIAGIGGGELEVRPVGFEEGEPVVEWHALDGNGESIASGSGFQFAPPAGAARVHVTVAGWLVRELAL